MTKKDLLRAMSDIDDAYILEAAPDQKHKIAHNSQRKNQII